MVITREPAGAALGVAAKPVGSSINKPLQITWMSEERCPLLAQSGRFPKKYRFLVIRSASGPKRTILIFLI